MNKLSEEDFNQLKYFIVKLTDKESDFDDLDLLSIKLQTVGEEILTALKVYERCRKDDGCGSAQLIDKENQENTEKYKKLVELIKKRKQHIQDRINHHKDVEDELLEQASKDELTKAFLSRDRNIEFAHINGSLASSLTDDLEKYESLLEEIGE